MNEKMYSRASVTGSLKDISVEVESVFGKQASLGRNVKMFLCQRYAGEKLKDIGTYFGIGEPGVSQACRRVKDKIRNDKKLGRKIAKIEKNLNVSKMMTDFAWYQPKRMFQLFRRVASTACWTGLYFAGVSRSFTFAFHILAKMSLT